MTDNAMGAFGGWDVIYTDEDNHVVPSHDLVEHDLSIDCWCQPIRSDGVVAHNSADEREHYERRSWSQYRINKKLN